MKPWLRKWIWRPLGMIAILALAVMAARCASVPLTGRSQLSLVGDNQLLQMSMTQYQQVLHQSKLSNEPQKVALIRKVGLRVSKASEDFLRENGLGNEVKNYKWEFNLIQDDKTVNAWCMPGGKIAFYTGILPICQDETGVAVVMGHEVAHALAKHGNERMSQQLLVQLGGMALAVALSQEPGATQNAYMAAFGMGAQVGVLLPFSRAHESEADRIGLTIMAKAGYDPHAAVGLWERMRDKFKGQKPPEFLSTHPAEQHRIDDIKKYLPEAMKSYRATLEPGPGQVLPGLDLAAYSDPGQVSSR